MKIVKNVKFLSLICCLSTICLSEAADNMEELDARLKNTFTDKLVSGRSYLKDFPKGKTRNAMVDDFLGMNGKTPKRPLLKEAIQEAIAIRKELNEPDPEFFDSKNPSRSLQAQVIAWESLESLLNGYNYAGNRDLLNGVRSQYPGGKENADNRDLPADEPEEFSGTAQMQLSYARLYFMQGIRDTIEFIEEDPTGKLRAIGGIYSTMPHYVTFDEEKSEVLPHENFNDPNFGDGIPKVKLDREPSQSAAYLYGSLLDRYGMVNTAYAEQLWKAAYAVGDAGVKQDPEKQKRMLAYSTKLLRNNIHAQFLAMLPVASQLNDGRDHTQSEYRLARIDNACVNIASAKRLRDIILAGEKPTQDALVLAWDNKTIEKQIAKCKEVWADAQRKWEEVQTKIKEWDTAEERKAHDDIALRNSLETQLLKITGVNPNEYGNLQTDENRKNYLNEIQRRFGQLLYAEDDKVCYLKDEYGNATSLNLWEVGCEMTVQALQIVLARKELIALEAKIVSYDKMKDIEDDRKNRKAKADAALSAAEYAAVLAIYGTAAVGEITYHTQGTASGFSIKQNLTEQAKWWQKAAVLAAEKVHNYTLADIESHAKRKNLSAEQTVLESQRPQVQAQITLAMARLNSLYAEARRLVDNHEFYQDSTEKLWYRDPNVVFEKEKVEEEYEELVQEYRVELYKLARTLGAAWCEEFQNPVKVDTKGSVKALGSASNYDDFTEAESVFAIPNHIKGKLFLNALKAWDTMLRDVRSGAKVSANDELISSLDRSISLRNDLMGLGTMRYDSLTHQYVEGSDHDKNMSKQKFTSRLQELMKKDPVNTNGNRRLRIEFPLLYGKERDIAGETQRIPLFKENLSGGTFDQVWNHRINKLVINIKGDNVYAGNPEMIFGAFELYGVVQRIGFFPDSLDRSTRHITYFDIPMYQRDPDKRTVEDPIFGAQTVKVAVNQDIKTDTELWRKKYVNEMNGVPLFCDNFVLRLNPNLHLKVENIEDIEFYITMDMGCPPEINWGSME